jgi:hypothetical protein
VSPRAKTAATARSIISILLLESFQRTCEEYT